MKKIIIFIFLILFVGACQTKTTEQEFEEIQQRVNTEDLTTQEIVKLLLPLAKKNYDPAKEVILSFIDGKYISPSLLPENYQNWYGDLYNYRREKFEKGTASVFDIMDIAKALEEGKGVEKDPLEAEFMYRYCFALGYNNCAYFAVMVDKDIISYGYYLLSLKNGEYDLFEKDFRLTKKEKSDLINKTKKMVEEDRNFLISRGFKIYEEK